MISNIKTKLLSSSLFKDSFWALSGNAIGKGLTLAAGIVVARFLGKDLYGEYGMIKSTLLYIAVFSTFGIGFTATKYIAQYKKEHPEQIESIIKNSIIITLFLSFTLASLLFVFAKDVANFLDAPNLYRSLRLMSVAVIFNAVNSAQGGLLAGFNAFKNMAICSCIVGGLTFIYSLIFTYFWGLEGAVLALTLSHITSCLLYNIFVRKFLKNYSFSNYSYENPLLKKMIKFSFPIALQEGCNSLVHWASIFLLIKMTNYGELGLYSASSQWYAIIMFVPSVLRNVTLSHLSGSIDDKKQHKKTLYTMLGVNFIATFIPFIVVLIFSGFIVSIYGDSFYSLRSVLNVHILNSIIGCLSSIFIQEFIAQGRNWFVFICSLTRDCLIILVTYFCISYYLSDGALILVSVSLVVRSLYLLTLFLKYKKENS